MNRAYYLILGPALLIALIYLGLGYRPSPRMGIGVAVFLAAAFWVSQRRQKRKNRNTTV